MRYIKNSLLVLLVTLCCFGSAFGQKADKMAKKAADRVEKLNQQITAGDEDAALTAEQTATITGIFTDMEKEIKALKKAGGDKADRKESMKAIRKAANKQVNKEVLTKEQRRAKKAAKGDDH